MKLVTKKSKIGLLSIYMAMFCSGTHAQTSMGPVKIGVMTDMSSLFSDIGGPGSVIAAQMAIDDFGGNVLGKPIQLISADHQNKPDVAANKAREWYDADKVSVIVDLLPSGVALSVAEIARQKNKIVLVSGGGTTRLTNENCSPNTVHYVYDTYSLATNTVNALMKRGKDSWYFITVDYALGSSLVKDAAGAVKARGGQVLGEVKHPTNTSDMSGYLLQAQASNAKVIGLANAGGDTIRAVNQAAEFGIGKNGKQTLAGLHVFITDIHAMGLQKAKGMILTTGFYWDLNDDTRKWSRRFFEKHKRMPTMAQAGVYSSTMHYLQAVKAAGTDGTQAVLEKMHKTPINDFFAKNGRIREDGMMIHDMLLVEVKAPEESKSPWDYYKVLSVIPGKDAFLPLSQSVCPLVKK
ncbi:ABC transporter substrate-binding protein [Polynucleobacter sinensis]|uniref:ABC transporter substrate-binding protein n=1 Tax=Polynucleobacter sinensis TaxID=1743157 RepID=UPI00078300EA|nr:ABC transporter substrate-binding protein [Polynucleobacter sinensis]